MDATPPARVYAKEDPPVRSFAENVALDRLPLRPPIALAVGVSTLLGVVAGALAERSAPRAVVHATFLGSAFGYLATSLLDFALHFRLERQRTGRWLGFTVVPKGESVNHVATVATLVSLLALSRQPPRHPAWRDRWTLAAPAVFLALGWRDELVYHRRRTDHREDMLHTVAHLAAGVMLTSFTALKTACWRES